METTILWIEVSTDHFPHVTGRPHASYEIRLLAYDLGEKKIRVNCISAGPMNTLAARGISDFLEEER